MDAMFVIPVYTAGLVESLSVALVFESEQEAKEFLAAELPYASLEAGTIGGRFFYNLRVTEKYDTEKVYVEDGELCEAWVDPNNIRDGVTALVYSGKAFGEKDTVADVVSRNIFLY